MNIASIRLRQNGGWAGDVTGRLGYTWGPAMLYAKGGFAWAQANLSGRGTVYDAGGNNLGYVNFDNNNSNDNTLTGWTVGAGVEWLLNPNWSVKLEYLYYDFSLDNNNWNPRYTDASGNVWYNNNNWKMFNNDLTVNTVKLGVNYHLNTCCAAPLK